MEKGTFKNFETVGYDYCRQKNLMKKNSVILTSRLNPKQAPRKVSGAETQNQRASTATRVPNGTAALLPSPHNTRLRRKNAPNITLKVDDSRTLMCYESVCTYALCSVNKTLSD